MAIIYTCRHCEHHIGKLEDLVVETAALGFNQLTGEEMQEMMEYQSNGDLVVYAICDSCTATLAKHPQYHELDYFIQ